jgi:hypothetical protein
MCYRLQPHARCNPVCVSRLQPRASRLQPCAFRCPLCRVRCQPADVWLLFVSNEVQPDTTRHQARRAELELLQG